MHIPKDVQLTEIGCGRCGATCPHTGTTNPPLTPKRAEIWALLHELVCPALACQCGECE